MAWFNREPCSRAADASNYDLSLAPLHKIVIYFTHKSIYSLHAARVDFVRHNPKANGFVTFCSENNC
jgi:hypothetical protein